MTTTGFNSRASIIPPASRSQPEASPKGGGVPPTEPAAAPVKPLDAAAIFGDKHTKATDPTPTFREAIEHAHPRKSRGGSGAFNATEFGRSKKGKGLAGLSASLDGPRLNPILPVNVILAYTKHCKKEGVTTGRGAAGHAHELVQKAIENPAVLEITQDELKTLAKWMHDYGKQAIGIHLHPETKDLVDKCNSGPRGKIFDYTEIVARAALNLAEGHL